MFEPWYCIDPGLSGLGIAAFRGKQLLWWQNYMPKGKDFQVKSIDALFYIETRISRYSKVYIEWPTGRFSGKRGLAAANSDSILKLTFLIGGLCSIYRSAVLIPVQKWKGQLPKIVTQTRAENYFGIKGFTSHASDAVGIGRWILKNKVDR